MKILAVIGIEILCVCGLLFLIGLWDCRHD